MGRARHPFERFLQLRTSLQPGEQLAPDGRLPPAKLKGGTMIDILVALAFAGCIYGIARAMGWYPGSGPSPGGRLP